MNGLFFVILTLSCILLQTVVFPAFSWFSQSFDIMIVVVLYLSLVYSHSAVVCTIVVIGGLMDSISGVPFGLHVFSYLWIYLIVQLFKQFVFQRSVVFILIISMVSVVIQQGLILFSVFINQGQDAIWRMDFTLMVRQIIWGGVAIPPGVWILNVLRQNWLYAVRMMRKQWEQKYRN